MVYSAKSDDINTISQFTRLKYIYITTNGTSTPVNYQVKLTIAYEPEMQSDFGDIRFNTLGHTYIDYWIESKTNGVTADVWVELPDAITDPGSNTIWMCYGNAGLGDGGDGADTFLLFDDFKDASIDTGIWDTINKDGNWNEASGVLTGSGGSGFWMRSKVVGTDYHVWMYGKGSDMDSAHFMGSVSVTTDPWSNGYAFRALANTNRIIIVRAGVDKASESISLTANTYYYHEVKKAGGSLTYKIYNSSKTLLQTVTYNDGTPLTGTRIALRGYGETLTTDIIYIRKSITNEPTPSYGTAQHQRRIPQFIN